MVPTELFGLREVSGLNKGANVTDTIVNLVRALDGARRQVAVAPLNWAGASPDVVAIFH